MTTMGTIEGQIFDFIDATSTPASTVTVIFEPSIHLIRNTSNDEITLLNTSWVPVTNDGTFSTTLIATDDSESNPINWTYTVKFSISTRSKAKRPDSYGAFSINVPGGVTTNLADIIPVSVSGGIITVQGPPGPHPDREYPVYWLSSTSSWETRPDPLPEGYDRAIFKSFFDSSATNPNMVAGDIWWKSVV